jgi:MFS family permease
LSIVLALIAGVVGAGLGFAAGAALGSVLAAALSISSFEGGAGYFAALIGLLGGLIGFILCSALTLRYQGGHRGFRAIALRIVGLIGLVCAIAAIGIAIRLATVEHFSGANPQLQFEIRLPDKASAPDRRKIDFEMQAGSQRSGGFLNDDWLRHDGERAVLRGFVPLYTRTSQRMLIVRLPDTHKLLFSIKLASTPRAAKTYGGWQRVDFLDDGKADSQPRKPNSSENYEIRYYVPESD